MRGIIPSIFFCLVLLSKDVNALSSAQYNTAYNALITYFRGNPLDQLSAVRLGFHACVGGCNGCLNLAQSDNNGLSTIVTNLNNLYASYNSQMSRADFWAIAALAGVGQGISIANRGCPVNTPNCVIPPLGATFRYGRLDCSTSPSMTTVLTFPSGAMNRTSMMGFFSTEFGFTETQVTTLLGVHTLGFALQNQSGYVGAWTGADQNAFDTKYYDLMFDSNVNWTPRDTANPPNGPPPPPNGPPPPPKKPSKWQFIGNTSTAPAGMMLNTDFELLYDLTLDSNAQPTCTIRSTCPMAATYSTAQSYSGNPSLWVPAFKTVFTQMLEHTTATLHSLT